MKFKFLKKVFSIFVLIFFSLILFANNPLNPPLARGNDSVKVKDEHRKSPVEYFTEKNFFPNNTACQPIDTLLDNIQKYFPNNFPFSLGLANRKLFFESSEGIGFNSGFDMLDLFGYNENDIKYFNTRTPYTEVFALFGMKKEQFARILHTQNITKRWNIALNMLRVRSEGFYLRQNCTDNNVSLSTNYTSKNNHYSLLANGIVSSIKTDENGGITQQFDTILKDNLFTNKQLFGVNIPSARTRRGNREFFISQFWNFGKKDTLMKKDSTHSARIIPVSSVSYTFHIDDSWFVYDDLNPVSDYYQNTYYDSTRTLDSTNIMKIENEISFKHLFKGEKKRDYFFTNGIPSGFDLSLKNQMVHIRQFEGDSGKYHLMDSTMNNLFATAIFHKSFFTIKGDYCFSGPNKNDLELLSDFRIPMSSHSVLDMKGEFSQREPQFLYNVYSANNFRWRNSFDKISETNIKISYLDSKYNFSVGGEVKQVSGYVYFDSTFHPTQFSDAMTISSAFIAKKFHFWKINFYNKITWQQASNTNIIHLPQFVTNHSLYYEDKWFKKVMAVQIGFDVSYYTSYLADSYMPALGLYYLQNKTTIGNYPYIDFFLNAKIKHARIFLKMEHINSGLMGVYYLAPYNPAPDRSFKVGINWVFYD